MPHIWTHAARNTIRCIVQFTTRHPDTLEHLDYIGIYKRY